VRSASREGLRSRSAYKLLEIQQRDRLLKPGMSVVDLGATPGGWSQVAARAVGPKGRVVAVDQLAMEPIEGVTFFQGDCRDQRVVEAVKEYLVGCPVDLVMSDMAPNMSGTEVVDQPRAMHLAEVACALTTEVLVSGGDLLVKVFQGEGFSGFVADLRCRFTQVNIRKPKASRPRSREVYLLARNYTL
jgi:23S rRNA methylase